MIATPAVGVRTVADHLRSAARRAPGAVALVAGDHTLSWSELDARVDRLAGGLRAAGLRPGDRVALSLGTTVEMVEAYLGVLRASLVAVPLNPGLTAGEVARVLADSASRLVVAGAGSLATARNAVAGIADALTGAPADLAGREVPLLVPCGAPPSPGEVPYASLDAEPADDARGGEDLAALLYTSGTSGRPRGAMLSHRALLANLEQVAAIEPPVTRPDDVVLGVLPLFHVYGLNAVLGMVLRTGATLVLCPRFDPDDALRLVRDHGVTNLPVAPPILVAWAGRDDLAEALRSVRLIVSGAAPLPGSVVEEVMTATGVPVHEGYGLTEAAPVLTTTLVSGRPRPGSIGRPVPGVELTLVDESGAVVEEGDPGEIVVRGANLFSGWWPDGDGGPDAEGWYRTGDVAYADAEGGLVLVDRLKELVVVSGFNVYPREVEDVLLELEGVAEAAVIAVPHPRTGEAVKAYLVPRPGAVLTTEAVLAHCRERLARFKWPTIVEVVDALPYAAGGKVAKGWLREREKRAAGLA